MGQEHSLSANFEKLQRLDLFLSLSLSEVFEISKGENSSFGIAWPLNGKNSQIDRSMNLTTRTDRSLNPPDSFFIFRNYKEWGPSPPQFLRNFKEGGGRSPFSSSIFWGFRGVAPSNFLARFSYLLFTTMQHN